jgi:hypothetical protein
MTRFLYIFVFLLSTSSALVAEVTEAEKKAIKMALFEVKDFKVEERTSKEFQEVFDLKAYALTGKVKDKLSQSNSSSTHNLMFIKHKQAYLKLEMVKKSARGGKIKDLKTPILHSVIKKGFRLSDRKAADTFEKALSLLYAYDLGSFGEDKMAGKSKVYKVNDEWFFVRGVFFKDIDGFVVKVDSKGIVKDIRYSYYLKPTTLTESMGLPGITTSLKKELSDKYHATLKANPKLIKSTAFNQVFDGQFYALNIIHENRGELTGLTKRLIVKEGNSYKQVQLSSGGTQKLKTAEQLKNLIKKDFKLKDKKQIETIKSALTELVGYTKHRKPKSEIIQKKNQFTVIFKESFKSYALILSTDKQGKILKVMYDPKYKK